MPKNSSACLVCCCYDNWECTVTQTLIHTPVTHKQCLGARWMGCIHLGGTMSLNKHKKSVSGIADKMGCDVKTVHPLALSNFTLPLIHIEHCCIFISSRFHFTLHPLLLTLTPVLSHHPQSSPLPSPSLHHSHTTLTPLQHSRTTPTLTGPPKQSKMLSEHSSALRIACSAAWVVFTGADQIRPTLRARRSRELKASRWIILLHRDRKLCCEWGMKFNRWGLAHAHPQHCAVARTYKLHTHTHPSPHRHCRATYISAKCHLNSISNQQQLLTHNM